MSKEIDEEHSRLAQMLRDLCETCGGSVADCRSCSKEKVVSCQGRLPSFLYDFQELVHENFDHEERVFNDELLSETDRHNLQLHRAAHANLMREIGHLIQQSAELSWQGDVATAIRHFRQFITDKFDDHAESYDVPLMHLINDSPKAPNMLI